MARQTENTGPSQEWLDAMIRIEDSCESVSVGGLACELSLLPTDQVENHGVFGRLIEFSRREIGMTVEKLAEEADIDLAELVDLELDRVSVPQVRTVFQLARVLKLPEARLLEVAGLTEPKPSIAHAAIIFAARSESTAKLSQGEREALEEFVRVLVEDRED